MNITSGQDKVIKKHYPDYDKNKSEVIAEAGSDNGTTFNGEFLAKIKNGRRKLTCRFNDGALTKAGI